MKKKRILICGASGFIGGYVFRRFSQMYADDYEVWGTYHTKDLSGPGIFRLDLTKKDDVMAAIDEFDVVIHAAAVTSGAYDIVGRPWIHVTDNMCMNSILLEAVHANKIPHFIFLSCTVVYPMNGDHPVEEHEADVDRVHKKYFGGAIVKWSAEKLCEFYSRLGQTKFTILRHSNVYGPGDKFDFEKSHLIGATIRKVMDAKDGDTIIVWGDGSEKRDVLYVGDLWRCIERVIDREQILPYEVFNIGAGVSYSVREIVETIVAASEKKLSVRYDTSKPSIPVSLTLDVRKAVQVLEWRSQRDFEAGIFSTILWYKAFHGTTL